MINASLAAVISTASRSSVFRGVYGVLNGISGLLRDRIVDLTCEDDATVRALKHTPGASLGSCRQRLGPGDEERVLATMARHDIRVFLYIGGNDSADTSHRIASAAKQAGYELAVIGVPKTIDNDLPFTDHSPGYGSIARFIAAATMDAGRDTESLPTVDPVKIIEVMGRNAGWVAAASALGKTCDLDAPHLIYFPERPLSLNGFVEDVRRVHRDIGHAVIVLTETVRDDSGQPLASPRSRSELDGFGHERLTGAAERLCHEIGQRLGLKARWDKPGTLQRTAMAYRSEVDVREAYQVGVEAVRLALRSQTDCMVTILREPGPDYRVAYGSAPLDAVANSEKLVPEVFINAQGNFVTDAFLDYARPLIGPPLVQYPRLRKEPLS